MESMEIAGNTAEALVALGMPLEVAAEDEEETTRLIEDAIKNKKINKLRDPNTAYAASAFLRTYGSQLALDISTTRAAITNKLMEIANCGDPKYELKALELLGKHSDIGLFTERSELTINYKTPEDLEEAIKTRVKRLLNSTMVDITPGNVSLDEELGVYEAKTEETEAPDASE